jgi:hypothetical protein
LIDIKNVEKSRMIEMLKTKIVKIKMPKNRVDTYPHFLAKKLLKKFN